MKQFRFATLGEANVGKTSIAQQLLGRQFSNKEAPTIGAAFNVITRTGETPIQLWDTAGGERYRSLVRHYTRDLDGCIIVGDLSDPDCRAVVERWLGYLKRESNIPIDEEELQDTTKHPVSIWIVGNKRDLVSEQEDRGLRELAAEYGCPFVRTSAKTSGGVAELLDAMFAECGKWEEPNATILRRETQSLTLWPSNYTPSGSDCQC